MWSIRSKLILLFVSFGFGVSAVFALGFYFYILPTMEMNLRKKLYEYAETIAAIVSPEKSADERQLFQRIVKANSDLDSIYRFAWTNNSDKILLVDSSLSDASKEGLRIKVGEEYSVTELRTFHNGFFRTTIDDNPKGWRTTDVYLSAASPIKNSQGEIVGAIGVSMRYDKFLVIIRTIAGTVVAVLIIFVLACLVIGFLVGQVFSNRLNEMAEKVEKLSLEGGENIFEDSEKELSNLGRVIDSLVDRAKSNREELKKMVNEKTADLQKRVAESEQLNRLMVDREIAMVELKKNSKDITKK